MHTQLDESILLDLLWQIETPELNVEDSVSNMVMKAAISSWSLGRGLTLIRKTFLWEYHIYRQSGGSYSDFISSISNGSLLDLIKEKYPVLIENYLIQVRILKKQVKLVAERIRGFQLNSDVGMMTGIVWGLGDSHNNGQQVHRVSFEKGTFVYKPRSLATEVAFYSYSAWIDSGIGNEESFFPKIIDCGNYGWMEFVEHKYALSYKELDRYYYRIGKLIATLFSLTANDMHYENIIAYGEFPVLIDLESCLQPEFPVAVNEDTHHESVLQIAMLPTKLWNYKTDESIEIGAISAREKQKLFGFQETISGFESGRLTLNRTEKYLMNLKNQPDIDGRNPQLWSSQIVQGFTDAYLYILNSRSWLLADALSPLQNFFNLKIRVFPRDTNTYYSLIKNSFHPAVMNSKKTYFGYYEWLRKNPVLGISDSTVQLIEFESLQKGDIPYFLCSASNCDLLSPVDGGEDFSIPNFFKRSAQSNVKNRLLNKMCLQDLDRQIWFIESSLQSISDVVKSYRIRLKEAKEIFERLLVVLGYYGDQKPNWIVTARQKKVNVFVTLDAIDMSDFQYIRVALEYYWKLFADDRALQLIELIPTVKSVNSFSFDSPEILSVNKDNKFNLEFIKKIDGKISENIFSKEVKSLFEGEVEVIPENAGSILSADFKTGLSGMLYLSCRYQDNKLKSIFEKGGLDEHLAH